MVGGTVFQRNVICVRFPESCSSASLANAAARKTAQEKFVLDTAFPLIEGHPVDPLTSLSFAAFLSREVQLPIDPSLRRERWR